MDSEIYHVFLGPTGARVLRVHEGETYVLVRVLPDVFLPRFAWVLEREVITPLDSGAPRHFPALSAAGPWCAVGLASSAGPWITFRPP
jgi:hypothetical protein